MKTLHSNRKLSAPIALEISLFLTLALPHSASAQTIYDTSLDNNITIIYGAIYSGPHYDAINFSTDEGGVLSVDQSVDFNGSALSNVFTSTTFTSTGGRVAASMVGVDWNIITPVAGRTFVVQNFALDNVDFTTSNGAATGDVGLKIQGLAGGDTSLSLANSTLSCAITPHLYTASAFTFNASGTSQIDGWAGHLSSTTALNAATGGSLRIKNCGDLSSGAPISAKLYFDQYSNSATLNGSSLIIDNSAFIFGRTPLGDSARESTMTFSNNANLQLTGLNPYTSLETDNIVFQGSTLNMATNNSRLTLRNTLELDNSSALLATGAQAHTAVVVAKGSSTVSLANFASLRTGTLDIRPVATMNLVASGDEVSETTVSSQVLFPTSETGTLNLATRAVLNLASSATMDLTSHASLTNNGSINLQDGRMTVRQGSSFTNSGELIVQDASSLSIDGNVTIGGQGTFNMSGTLSFTNPPATPAANSLTVYSMGLESPASLTSNSSLQMALNPTGLSADRLTVSHQLDIESRVGLTLSLVNDTQLALGTKFLLVDYPDWQAFNSSTHFNGLPDGTQFALGLNSYQINYNDPDVQTGATHFITLTTVPEPATVVMLCLGSLGVLARSRRRRA